MKKRILSMIITLALVFGCGAMQAFAADAKVTASLPADKKTVSSGYAAFTATNMFGKVYDISKYPIRYQVMGSNNPSSGTTDVATSVTIVPGASSSKSVNTSYNSYKIVLTGWSVDHAVKGCIGYGYVE